MDPVNRIGAKAFLIINPSEKKPSREEDLAEALRNATKNLYTAQDDMMERHEEIVKKGLEENKKIWEKRSREKALDKINQERERYFEDRSREAAEKERELASLLLGRESKSLGEKALLMEKRALEEDDHSLALTARERGRVAAREAAREEQNLQNARRRKDRKGTL